MPEPADQADRVLAQYVQQCGGAAAVVARECLTNDKKHRSGDTRSIYRYKLAETSSAFTVFAKTRQPAGCIQKEFQIVQLLFLSQAPGSPVTVPAPLLAAEGVLLTKGFSGSPLQQVLHGWPRRNFRRTEPDALFFHIGSWLDAFHAHTSLKELLGRAEREGRHADRPVVDGCEEGSGPGLFFECLRSDPAAVMRRLLADYLERWGGRYLDASLKNDIYQTLPQIIAAHPPTGRVGPIHGDFCHHNILFELDQQRACIFDFERAAIGWQIFDVVRFCAKLRHLAVRIESPFARGLLEKLEKSFLDGYSARKACDPFTFDALFLIALLCIRSPLELEPGAGITSKLRGRARRRRYRRLIERTWTEVCITWKHH